MAELTAFRDFNEATAGAVPTIVAFDLTNACYVIGDHARQHAMSGRPAAQDFKLSIGDPDASFEGKPSTKPGRQDTRWLLRRDLSGTATYLSTREVARIFLQTLIKEMGEIPKQLIIGLPAITEEEWQKNYRRHISQLLAEMGLGEPAFFPEPYAVFQYYRYVEKLIPSADHSLTVLIVDYGGGTLNYSIIETTREGNLSRGGATASPLGVESVKGGGKEIDLRLLKLAISKLKDPALRKESVEARVALMPWALLIAEEIKIALAGRMTAQRLNDDCSQICETRVVPAGYYHPEISFEMALTGEDLKNVIRGLWMSTLGPAILQTIKKAKYGKVGLRFTSLDKVVLAGGSSGLPFLTQLLATTLSGEVEVKTKDIIIGKDVHKAVAYGLAIEAKEQRKRALRTNNSVGPCVFSPLYLYVGSSRVAKPEKPYVWRVSGDRKETHAPGALLAGPMKIGGLAAEYEIKLPFRPHHSLFYWFCDSDQEKSPSGDRLNVQQDVLQVPQNAQKTFALALRFGEDGIVQPTFKFGDHSLKGGPFLYGGLKIARDVDSYAGIDLGTSNTYVVNLWAESKAASSQYPVFRISDSAGVRLRKLDQEIEEARKERYLRPETAVKYASEKQSEFVFHSIKIEGSSLTRGETDDLLEQRKTATNAEMVAPGNVRDAYQFILKSAAAYKETPEAFIREIQKIVMRGIDQNAGTYRTIPVKLSNVPYEPPPATDVPPFMEAFASELKAGPLGKSIVHFAGEAHSKLVAIHPFSDGNGRTARLLMDAILMDAQLPPAIVHFQDKERYLDCLNLSNGGDLSSFMMLLAETISASIDEMRPRAEPVVPATVLPVKIRPKITPQVPSELLAEIVRKKAATFPVERGVRYKAWQAGFESLRQEFQSVCLGFNELLSADTLFRAEYKQFDTLPYEKYETLLRGLPTPKTWSFCVEVSSERHSEQFIFFFQLISDAFTRAGRKARPPIDLPPRDVTLSISRRSDGTYHRLQNEPIRLREIHYVDGRFFFMKAKGAGMYEVVTKPSSEVVNNFLADVVGALF